MSKKIQLHVFSYDDLNYNFPIESPFVLITPSLIVPSKEYIREYYFPDYLLHDLHFCFREVDEFGSEVI